MNKRILFVIDNLKIGGAEQVFTDIAKLCKNKLNFDVLLITDFNGDQFLLPEEIEIIKLRRKSKYNISDILTARNILSKYECVHIHMRHTFRYLRIIKLLFCVKSKFIFHDHYGRIGIDKAMPFRFYSILKPDVYIGVCDELCDWAINVWKLKTENVNCLVNTPNIEMLNNLQHSENKVNNGKIVMVGNIKPIKNQLFALRIVHSLNLSIDFIGKNQDGLYFNSLINQVQNCRIIENCTDVKGVLTEYKLGVFTSMSESGPLVVLEYLLSGIPFVSYNTGGIAKILSEYFPDFFLDDFDEEKWKSRILDFFHTPPLINREEVKEIIDKEFNSVNYLNKLIEIYEK